MTSGFTRRPTRAVAPTLAGDPVDRRSSASDSTLISDTPASSASRSSRSRLPHAAEDDVLAAEAGAERAIQLAAGDDVHAGAQLAQQPKDAARSSSP